MFLMYRSTYLYVIGDEEEHSGYILGAIGIHRDSFSITVIKGYAF